MGELSSGDGGGGYYGILRYSLVIQRNPDITMYQGTGEITSLYRGIVKPGFRSIHFTVTGIGRAEKC